MNFLKLNNIITDFGIKYLGLCLSKLLILFYL